MFQNAIIGAVILAPIVVFIYTIKYIDWYYKARRQFPGPAVKSVWNGNLDEVLQDDIHEKVSD